MDSHNYTTVLNTYDTIILFCKGYSHLNIITPYRRFSTIFFGEKIPKDTYEIPTVFGLKLTTVYTFQKTFNKLW